MAKVVKVIELMSQSPKSWEDAAQASSSKPCGISAIQGIRRSDGEKISTIASTQILRRR